MEYLSYLNQWLIYIFGLLVFLLFVINLTTFSVTSLEFTDLEFDISITFMCLLFLILILIPSLLLVMDTTSFNPSSFIVYSFSYQWAWAYTVDFGRSLPYHTTLDQVTLSSLTFPMYDGYDVEDYYLLGAFRSYSYLFEVNSTLILPCFTSLKLYLFSLDVIHSFCIYSLGLKLDAIPGKINSIFAMKASIHGYARGFCYELCGIQHNHMLIMRLFA